ncbi:MAG: WYL domain-containing protein [Propionibacteriaceae bacterium]|jgi:predicted DNA-binding transcriptional regulator YafY|nr:WYL domain-containing protein [Propionibacteriaceae bacterium]
MAPAVSERILNLMIALLVTKRLISRREIFQRVSGYLAIDQDRDVITEDPAADRKFQRDLENLQQMGIEVIKGTIQDANQDVGGYRIDPGSFYLPDIHLTPREAMVAAMASSAWSEASLASGVGTAVRKLHTLGEETSGGQSYFLTPRLRAAEPGLAQLWEGFTTQSTVEFTYNSRVRRVNIWRMIGRSGAWYVLGESVGEGPKIFKVARIEDTTRVLPTPQGYETPDQAVISREAESLNPPPDSSVLVAIRVSTTGVLRKRGTPVDSDGPEGFDVYRIPYARVDEIVFAICASGPDVLVLEEGEVRDRVIAQLQFIAGGQS